jgi:LPXTG-motif cell wall-anchored protein
MPGFVHRFAPGHRIRLVVAGSSQNYLNGRNATPVTVTTEAGASGAVPADLALPLQSITLPTIGRVPPSRAGTGTPPTDGAPGGTGGGGDRNDEGPGPAGAGSAGETRAENDDAQVGVAAPGRAAPGAGPNTWLPDTGGPAFWLLLTGALLTGAGAWLVSRRRATGSDGAV